MAVRVLRAGDGELLGPPDGARDRFLLGAAGTGGRVSLVEHHAPAGVLIAPLHRHSREYGFSLVLEGWMGAVPDGESAFTEVGDLVWKPRGAWHTFWNAGEGPVRILEVISPGGLEERFETLDRLEGFPDPEALARLVGPYGPDIAVEGTASVLERHGLRMRRTGRKPSPGRTEAARRSSAARGRMRSGEASSALAGHECQPDPVPAPPGAPSPCRPTSTCAPTPRTSTSSRWCSRSATRR